MLCHSPAVAVVWPDTNEVDPFGPGVGNHGFGGYLYLVYSLNVHPREVVCDRQFEQKTFPFLSWRSLFFTIKINAAASRRS